MQKVKEINAIDFKPIMRLSCMGLAYMRLSWLIFGLMIIFTCFKNPALAQDEDKQWGARQHGVAIRNDVLHGPDFTHFNSVNPHAPKGGRVVFSAIGAFDSFNQFIVKGDSATGLGLIYDTLLKSSPDEKSAYYGLLAEWVQISDDGLSIRFKLRDGAKFHDGETINADDVVWSFQTLINDGAPLYRFYYGDVTDVYAESDKLVRFDLGKVNPEKIVILGQLPVFPKHYWQDKDFTKTTLTPPLGSGPYKINDFSAGKFVEYQLNDDYWAKELAVNQGFHNYGLVRYEYYRDRTIAREAFKADKIDIWVENNAKEWATAFDGEAIQEGRIIKGEFSHDRVAPMQGFVFNQRKPVFQDVRVREALTYAWDFEWVNKNIMYNAYQRTRSYFDNSPMAATGLPDAAELAILNPYKDKLDIRVFNEEYHPPSSDGQGQNRENLRKAALLLREAGWQMQDGILTHSETGIPLRFEILLYSDSFVPHTQSLVRGVERLGGEVDIRLVDTAQYIQRVRAFDFDMVMSVFAQSDSPGNEQREYWGSQSADLQGGRNLFGLKSTIVDELIEGLIIAPDREALNHYTKALDRVLQWNFLLIPGYYSSQDRIAYWNRFSMPDLMPANGVNPNLWWFKDE